MLTPIVPETVVDNPDKLFSVVKGSFAHRRKSLWNNMLQMFGKQEDVKQRIQDALDSVNIASSIRAERLSLNQLIVLYEALKLQGLIK